MGRGRAWRALALAAVAGCLSAPASASGAASPAIRGAVQSSTDLSATISVAVSGNYAYTTAYQAGELTAVDISTPTAPVVAGHSPPDSHLIGGSNVAIAGGYAFVVSKNRNASTTSNDDGNGNSLTILDVHTNPASPSIVGTVRDPGRLFGSYGIAVSGHYAYVAYQGLLSGQPSVPDTSTGGLTVIDFSTIGSPAIVANIDNGALPAPYTGQNLFAHSTSVAIAGHYAYVTAFNSAHFTVVDISNPASPQIVGTVQDNNNLAFAVDVAVQGNYAYVADQAGGSSPELTVINISNPAVPTVAGTLNAAALNGAYRIRVRGSFAYESAFSAGTVSAIDISTPSAPRLAGFVYDANRLNKTTGLDLDSTGSYVVASSPYLPTESNHTYPPYPDPTVPTAPTATGTISVIALDPAAISVAITPASEPANPTTQTSAAFGFTVNDTVSTVQCSLDGAPYGACTTATAQNYSALSGGPHTFSVRAQDPAGHTSTASYTWTIDAAPANSGAPPSISGSTQVGATLTASPGGWSGYPAPSFSYQWNQCDAGGANCTPIAPATGATYVVASGDAGHTLTVSVTASNGFGSATATSAAAGPVTSAPANTGAPPSISGSAQVGATLTASPGGWSGSPTFAYQWQQCDGAGTNCAPIASATGVSYVVAGSDAGHMLTVVVTATNGSGATSATAIPVGPATQAPSNTGAAPSISGTPQVGATLTASPGGWSGSPAPGFTYAWQQCTASGTGCAPISGATAATYVVAGPDAGHMLTVAVTAANSAGAATATATAVGPVPAPPGVTGAPPSISGTALVGKTLTASPGVWSGSPTFSYQWLRCAATGGGCANINGATAASYLLAAPDAGHTVQVLVTGANSAGSGSASSSPTAVVAAVPANTAAPTISGTAAIGQTLTAANGTWTGYPIPSLGDQWMRCNSVGESCVFIGATATTYTVTSADVGHAVRLYVRATNSAGSTLARSGYTAVVAPGTSVRASGVAAGRARLALAVAAGASADAVSQLTITLPAGLSFSAHHLASAVKVTGAGGHPLKFRLAVRSGALVITLRAPASGLKITVNAGGLRVSSHLRSQVRRHPGTRVALRVAVRSASGWLSRQTAALALS